MTRAGADDSCPVYVLDRTVRRFEQGRVLLGGEPARLVRLKPRAAAELDRLLGATRTDAAEIPDGPMEALVGRLVRFGLLHRVPGACPSRLGELSVVVPVRDDPDRLARLLDALVPDRGDLDVEPPAGSAREIVVVDDGSGTRAKEAIARAAAAAGAQLVRHPVPLGPGAARNSGLANVTTPFVAFVDSDVLPEQSLDAGDGWLASLLGHFDDSEVAAVAPRVVAAEPAGGARRALVAYESRNSPLDCGSAPALVGLGHRIRYVPGAAFVARTSVMREMGGFDSPMRYGEDVDLVWRMVGAGWVVRYSPVPAVRHDVRQTLAQLAEQRFSYGRSAAALAARHHGAVPAYECSRRALVLISAVAGVSCLSLSRRALWAACAGGALSLGVPALSLAGKLRRSKLERAGLLAARLILQSAAGELAGLSRSMRRAWWPFSAVLVALLGRGRRGRAPAVAFLALPSILEAVRQARVCGVSGTAWFGISCLDDLSYGAGVWAGALQEGLGDPLVLRIVRRSGGSTHGGDADPVR